jgi:ketosteroid isomerase-like protein
MEDRIEAARDVMRQVIAWGDWEGTLDPDLPPDLAEFCRDTVAAYRRGDLEWLLEHADPEIEIVQVPEIPYAQTYAGHDGLVEALLDWPRQWEDFRIEPERIFAADPENLIVKAIHGGRPHSMDIEVEAEIVFVFHMRDGLMARWDMYLTLDEALSRAAQSSADRDDDHAAQRDGGERAQEAGPEELRADHR